MTAYRPALDGTPSLAEGCNSCASLAGLVLSFIACFILLVIAPLMSINMLQCFGDFSLENGKNAFEDTFIAI